HDAGHDIHYEYDNGRFLNGNLHLLADLSLENIIRTFDIPTGIDHGKLCPVPFSLAIQAIAGYAAHFLDNGPTRLRQSVKQGGFSYVGSSYYGYNIAHLDGGYWIMVIGSAGGTL